MNVEIVYATPDEQLIKTVELVEGATVRDAVLASGFTDRFDQLVLDETPVGIYGVRVTYADELQDGDRVELYRPLVVDPMEARRARAKAQKGRSAR